MTSIERAREILDCPCINPANKKLNDAVLLMINPGLFLLPPIYDTIEARAMLLTIAQQESRLIYRHQIGGPARGFFQFEKNGIVAVLKYQPTKYLIKSVLDRLNYPSIVECCYEAVEHNDPLACVFARLLLWSSSKPLPKRFEPEKGWHLYLSTWRPGKPRKETWNGYFNDSWSFLTKDF